MGFTRRPHEKDTRNSRWGYDAAVDFQRTFSGLFLVSRLSKN